MDRIVGVVPAGGRARRIHGFFKEMMPIGVNETDRSKFVVSSEQIIERMFFGGANSVHFVLGSRKMFVADYFAYQHLFEGKVNFNSLAESVEELGMPYTIDTIFEQIRDHEYVMMGMPDTVIEPSDCYRRILQLLQERMADLVLGLFRTDSRNRGGYIEFERDSKRVSSHFDKTSPQYPGLAENTWAIACWSRKFTQYMHELLRQKNHPTIRSAHQRGTELLFGDIIDIAVADRSIHTIADFVDEKNGFYWDITEPEKYFQLLRYYSPGDVGPQLVPDAAAILEHRSKRVFIGHGHSKCWETLRDLLRDRLQVEWEEFNRI
jgi:glucose-1-phosphate thymidylyltransferase